MARKNPVYYDSDRLMGEYLTREDCARLDYLRGLDKTGEGLHNLSGLVYDLPEQAVELMESHRSDAGDDLLSMGSLRPYQTIAVAFSYYARSLVIGDSVGLGKTHVSAGLINLLSSARKSEGLPTRVLYLTDKNAVVQGSRELMRTTGKHFFTSTGTDSDVAALVDDITKIRPDDASVVASHSIINSARFQDFLIGFEETHGHNMFDLIIIDEGSIVAGNSTTKIYKNADRLFRSCSRKVLLNATAFETELDKFYNQLNFIDDSFLMLKKDYAARYKDEYFNGYHVVKNGYKNAEDFRKKIEFRYIKSTRKELGAVMKDCSANLIKVPLTKSQSRLLRSTSLPYQVYDAPWTLDPEATTNKTVALAEIIDRYDLMGEQLLIYSHFKGAQEGIGEVIADLGMSFAILNGDTSYEDRQEVIDQFQRGTIQVLITNVQKALNFGNCSHCIFYSFDPNPNKMVQVEGRMTRSMDIIDKHVYLITTDRQELERLRTDIKSRAQASADFSGRDFSMILDLLSSQL